MAHQMEQAIMAILRRRCASCDSSASLACKTRRCASWGQRLTCPACMDLAASVPGLHDRLWPAQTAGSSCRLIMMVRV